MKLKYPFSKLHKAIVIACGLTLMSCGGGSGSEQQPIPDEPVAPPPPPTPVEPTPIVDLVAVQTTSTVLSTGGCNSQSTSVTELFNDISLSAGLCFETEQSPLDGIPARVGGGIAVADVNVDGKLDLYITHARNTSGKLLIFSETNTFENVTEQSGIQTSTIDHAAYWVDLDKDRDPDLITFLVDEPFVQFFANQGDNNFSNVSHLIDLTLSKTAYSLAAGDIDLDNDLDFFISHWDPENEQHQYEFLWERIGAGVYQDISQSVELEPFNKENSREMDDEYSFTPIFADINDDAFPDLLVAADWGTSQYLVNNGGTGFVDETIPVVISDRAGMGAAVADYDNDGDLDWFVSAIGDPREEFLTIGLFDGNRLYQNDGNGNFLNLTDYAGVRQGYWAWGSCFADFNNDGYEDLFVVNGYNGWTEEQSQSGNFTQFSQTPALLYINQGDGTFEEQSEAYGIEHTGMGRGLVCYDYERDGDIDIIIANNGASPTLYRNDSDAKVRHFINVRIRGLLDNPLGVGARIYLTTANSTQMRELQLGNHFVSQNPVEAHFGLNGEETITEIRIRWPGNEYEDTVLTDIPIDHFITVHHPGLDAN